MIKLIIDKYTKKVINWEDTELVPLMEDEEVDPNTEIVIIDKLPQVEQRKYFNNQFIYNEKEGLQVIYEVNENEIYSRILFLNSLIKSMNDKIIKYAEYISSSKTPDIDIVSLSNTLDNLRSEIESLKKLLPDYE